MSDPLRIAIACPYPWPPADDLAWEVAAQARALQRRGHEVTVLAPGTRSAGAPEPADGPRVVIVGRAIRTSRKRSVADPRELAAGLVAAFESSTFDVVHVHDPLAPYPALAALRRTESAAIGWFHRPLAGAAFLGPLVERSAERLDLRLADSALVRRAADQVVPGDFVVVAPGAHVAPAPLAPGVAIVARGRDRAGMRFTLAVVRALAGDLRGPVRLMGPRESPWRTRTAVPKALRDRVEVVPDTGPESWETLLGSAATVLLATAADVSGPLARMALASGRAIVAPDCAEAEGIRDRDGVRLVTPFTRGDWGDATREAFRNGAPAPGTLPDHDELAETLERLSLEAIARRAQAATERPGSITMDLRLRMTPGMDPAQVAKTCAAAGLDAVAVVAPGGLEPARAVAAAAPGDLSVVIGQEIRTSEGVIAGLFMLEPVPDGESLAETTARIFAQGGMVLVPHPDTADIPSAAALRAAPGQIDAIEVITATGGPGSLETARAASRMGVVVSAGTGSAGLEGVGVVAMRLRPFSDGRDCVAALRDAEVIRPQRQRRPRRGRHRASRTT